MRKALHVDSRGRARMVDVGQKPVTRRAATARGRLVMSARAFRALETGRLAKGDALAVARIAGVQAAKRTSEIVPLCHALALDSISVEIDLDARHRAANVTASATIRARTGVEMEVLTAVAAACLTLYDMVKGIDRSCSITEIMLLAKRGGRSGIYRRSGVQ